MATGLFNLKQVNQAISQGAWSGYIAPKWVEYLVVAGGGGGRAGGSGGGGLLTGIVTVATGTSYTVTVGGGGSTGANGSDSVFGSIAATGGATGASGGAVANSGGSGGAGYGTSTYTAGAFGVSGQGNAGGAGNTTAGGGGGGAGTIGIAATSTAGGNGGAGIASAISGTVVTYAGGSGGGGSVSGGTGGVGGGGTGAVNAATAGGGNTGGGGGSSYNGPAAAGGSGIVVVRYPGNVQFFTGGTVNYNNGYIIHIFTSSGTLAPTTPTPYNTSYQISRSLRFNEPDTTYLSRTPASSGNRKTYTFSAWIKRSKTGSDSDTIISSWPSGSQFRIFFRTDSVTDTLRLFSFDGTFQFQLITTQVFRDFSAWGHLVVAIDTTQATAANRVRVYWNGVEITAFSTATYPTQNTDLLFNQASQPHTIGATQSSPVTGYYNGYMTEFYFVDGQQLTPSSFGATSTTTGVWAPIQYTGTYGTNGFYLNFSDNSNTTAATLGKDYSGNGNNWTPNNFSVTAGAGNDSLVDSPTSYGVDTGVGGTVRGNYATLNPLTFLNATFANGNLDAVVAVPETSNAVGTFGVSSGQWYWEVTPTTTDAGMIGICDISASATNRSWQSANGWSYFKNGNKYNNNTGAAYGSSWVANDVIGVALDMDAGTLVFYKNGTSQGTAYSTGLTGKTITAYLGNGNGTGASQYYSCNFGQRPFAYTAPSGYKALCTQNLPTPTIGATTATQANLYFNPVLYTGDRTDRTITVGFQPDWVWVKSRSAADDHYLMNAVVGTGKYLSSNSTASETTNANSLTAYTSTGFSVGNTGTTNETGRTYVAWNWKANGSGSTNTSGSITSTVSANTTSGFSVLTYTGTGTTATIGHGLGVTPSMIIVKSRSTPSSSYAARWSTYHVSLGNTKVIRLESTEAAATASYWNNTTPTSNVFSVDGDIYGANVSGVTYVAYCFAEVAGYSKFGSYTGNGSTDGPFVYTGFRPAYVLAKKSSGIEIWFVLDSKRGTYNVNKPRLNPNNSDAESTAYDIMDFTSNGFKLRNSDTSWNANGDTYIFAAFAESPFKYSLAR